MEMCLPRAMYGNDAEWWQRCRHPPLERDNPEVLNPPRNVAVLQCTCLPTETISVAIICSAIVFEDKVKKYTNLITALDQKPGDHQRCPDF